MLKMVLFPVLSFALSLGLIPLVIAFCKKHNLYDFVNARKVHTGNIPRLGGVGIAISFIVISLIFILTTKDFESKGTIPLIIAGSIIFAFGLLDDLFNLSAKIKLIVQIAATTIVVVGGFRFTLIFNWQVPVVLSYILTFFWVLGIINAYNLIDGLDGLCGSLSFSAMMTLGISFAIFGNSESTICFILAGSILGFLVYNWPPAKIFMGDNGSQFLGFMVAITPLYTSADTFEFNKFLIMLVLVSFPMMDTIAAIWRRLRDHRPIMSPDRSHLHHKLLNLGYTKKQALILVVLIQTLLCAAVILSYFLQFKKGTAILAMAYVFMVVFFSVIHYTNRAVMRVKKIDAMGNPIIEEDEEKKD